MKNDQNTRVKKTNSWVVILFILTACSNPGPVQNGGSMDSKALATLKLSSLLFNKLYGGKKISFDGADISDCGISGANLSGVSFRNVRFNKVAFKKCNFTGADFSESVNEADKGQSVARGIFRNNILDKQCFITDPTNILINT